MYPCEWIGSWWFQHVLLTHTRARTHTWIERGREEEGGREGGREVGREGGRKEEGREGERA